MNERGKTNMKAKEQGMILVIVLWFVSCIALLVSSFNSNVFSATTVIREEISGSRNASILDAGVAMAAFRMIQAGENQWVADGRAYREVIDGVPIEIRVVDEAGKVDLNKAKPELLTRFLERFVTTPREAIELTEAILTVREAADANDTGARGSGGPPIASSNAGDSTAADKKPAFVHISQLLDVPGFNYKFYQKLAPFITVHNRRGKININTADREVMLSLPNVTPIEVDRMIASRGLPQEENTKTSDQSDDGSSIKSEKAGPAYTVIVRQVTDAEQAALESRTTILVGPNLKAQFHVLAWQLSAR